MLVPRQPLHRLAYSYSAVFPAMQIQLCLTIWSVILSLTPMRTATITAMRRGTPAALILAMRIREIVQEAAVEPLKQ